MNILFDKLNALVQKIGQSSIAHDSKEINDIRLNYYGLRDEELQALCHNASRGAFKTQNSHSKGLFKYIFGLLGLIIGRKTVDPLLLEHVALGIEAFCVAPADLPNQDTARLYPQQIQAAVALIQHSLVQMDTGEGKTYAILPAAFALAVKHYRVYILCANEYLTWRDAKRTKPYWDFVGLPLGLCIRSTAYEEWS